MSDSIRYTCSCCGKEHENWPSIVYSSPVYYNELSEEEKKNIAELDEDFCIIRNENDTDRFIRCTLTQKVNDHCEDLEYGLWVSLSQKSYDDYSANFKNELHETEYFGWLSNFLPDYDFKESIPTTVLTKINNQRPEIFPHRSFDHPFVHDYYNGITKIEAERRINEMFKSVNQRSKSG